MKAQASLALKIESHTCSNFAFVRYQELKKCVKQEISQNEDSQLQVLLRNVPTGIRIQSNRLSVIYWYIQDFENARASYKQIVNTLRYLII